MIQKQLIENLAPKDPILTSEPSLSSNYIWREYVTLETYTDERNYTYQQTISVGVTA